MAIVRTRSVLDRIGSTVEAASGTRRVEFASRDDDTGRIERLLTCSFADWQDMGSPERVTVTVEPGDLLNG